MAISLSAHMQLRGKRTAAEVLTGRGYRVVKTETRENVIVRTWRKEDNDA